MRHSDTRRAWYSVGFDFDEFVSELEGELDRIGAMGFRGTLPNGISRRMMVAAARRLMHHYPDMSESLLKKNLTVLSRALCEAAERRRFEKSEFYQAA